MVEVVEVVEGGESSVAPPPVADTQSGLSGVTEEQVGTNKGEAKTKVERRFSRHLKKSVRRKSTKRLKKMRRKSSRRFKNKSSRRFKNKSSRRLKTNLVGVLKTNLENNSFFNIYIYYCNNERIYIT